MKGCTNTWPSVFGATRSLRDRPAPFSITSSSAPIPLPDNQLRIALAPRWVLPGACDICAPIVNRTWRAITLLLYLLISRITSGTAGDCHSANTLAEDATLPGTTLPEIVPPRSLHI